MADKMKAQVEVLTQMLLPNVFFTAHPYKGITKLQRLKCIHYCSLALLLLSYTKHIISINKQKK